MRPLQLLADTWNVIFPDLCLACEQPLTSGEKIICLSCQLELPKTDYHTFPDNPVAKHFWGKIPVEFATALYHFHKSTRIQHLLHQLKYKGRKDVGVQLGKLFGYTLQKVDAVKNIDMITSVPLHKDKELKRGYNQADAICEGLSEVLHIPFDKHAITRMKFSETQTKKGRLERWENVKEIFSVPDPARAEGKHILIIDDVITTGSTIEACAVEFLKYSGVKISIAAVAHAEM